MRISAEKYENDEQSYITWVSYWLLDEFNLKAFKNFRFEFEIPVLNQKEIHTEVYVFGYLFTFAQGDGLRITEVSPHWLYKTTNGKFGEKSKRTEMFGKDFESNYFLKLDSESC